MSELIDLTGKTFGRLHVVKLNCIKREARWECLCDCGKIVVVRGSSLRSGHTTSCGCLLEEMRVNKIGARYGKLTVLSFAKRENNKAYYNCKCDCGNYSVVYITNNTKSCGCMSSIGIKTTYKNNKINETKIMNNGLMATIIEYINTYNITVKFENNVIVKNIAYGSFIRGTVRCSMIYKQKDGYMECENPNIGLIFKIDNDDFNTIKDIFWSRHINGYAFNLKYGLLHKLIIDCPKGMTIDHINGDKLDNRKSNLRICTQAQNCQNRPKKRGSKSKYKGVSWHREMKKWVANICYNKKQIRIGFYNTPEEAYKAYCLKANELHGEFARFA